ncbi:hypothetical protein [Arthrobacter sp. MYb227]|nr:hypothetical protein [Arthrobacter sp. MYb227]
MTEHKKMVVTISCITVAIVLLGGFLLSGGLSVFFDSGAEY